MDLFLIQNPFYMEIDLAPGWQNYLQPEFEKPYFKTLSAFVEQEYTTYTCYPNRDAIFNAFNYCPIDQVKVVIIGQDPYHGPGQANGLCFSVNDGMPHPPSLKNIFKELQTDLGKPYPESGNLEAWAHQGVLLLNAALTVRAGMAGSHQNKGWEIFTNQVIKILSEQPNPLIFLLWGGFAKQKKKLIDTNKHIILSAGHPSPLSANRGYWFGNRCFSQANAWLHKLGKAPIAW